MKKIKLIEELESICENNVICRIERGEIDELKKSGKPIKFSDDFVLICYEYDFEFDGFEIIRLDDITNIQYDNVDKFINYIFINEDIKPVMGNIFSININSYIEIMQFFLNKNENIIIECEKHGEFYIGKVIEVFKDCVKFLCFDAEGVWDKEPYNIFYKDITSISFRNRYLIYMSKYARTIQSDGLTN